MMVKRWVLCTLLLCSIACRDAPTPSSSNTSALTPSVRELSLSGPDSGTLHLPSNLTSVKFAVIGDSGRGTPPQHEVAAQMVRFRESFPYQFVLMLGDNIYEGPATADDYRRKFEEPYRGLLDAGVELDDPRQIAYQPFNMNGERYYTFAPPVDVVTKIATRVEFFAIDSSNLDGQQLRWLDQRLGASTAEWKIVFLHHPLYTSGRYTRSSRAHRWALEPMFVRHGVDAVFSGHEHIYQRAALQHGIQYFISGAAGSLRLGDGSVASYIAKTYDNDYHFMLIEIDGDDMHFQAINRTGETIDAGTLYQDENDARERDRDVRPPGTAARQ